jgi:hypothetical protein
MKTWPRVTPNSEPEYRPAARESADQGQADRTGDHENGRRTERQDARAQGHGPKVQPQAGTAGSKQRNGVPT